MKVITTYKRVPTTSAYGDGIQIIQTFYGLGYCDFILKTHHLALTTTLENYCGHGLDWREEE